MSRWNHNICANCWNRENSSMPLADDRRGQGPEAVCCFCGLPNEDGIYVRRDPAETNCDGNPTGEHMPRD